MWNEIESWLGQHAPLVLKSFRPPVDDRYLASVQVSLGCELPADYCESLRTHDGQQINLYGCSPGSVHGLNFYPLSKNVSIWKELSELYRHLLRQEGWNGSTISTGGPVRNVWWDKQWIPIADDGNNNCWCLDLNPPEGGKAGQVIEVPHDEWVRIVLADSFAEWMEEFASGLTSGQYIYSEFHSGLITIEEAMADGIISPQGEKSGD